MVMSGIMEQLSSAATLVITLSFVLNIAVLCNGGITSSFVRKVEKTIDMPLDSDVFRVPLGYNAPQQVCVCLSVCQLAFLFLPPFAFGVLLFGCFSLFNSGFVN